LIQNYNDVV